MKKKINNQIVQEMKICQRFNEEIEVFDCVTQSLVYLIFGSFKTCRLLTYKQSKFIAQI